MKTTCGFIVLLMLMVPSVYADGVFVSDEHQHLYLPNQKTVITWDGRTEEMIIASSVRWDNISNMAWIVPIPSFVKPEVEAGDISMFQDLVEYFRKTPHAQETGFFDGHFGRKSSLGVEVLETKEVDIYDIAILRADGAQDLLAWLKENGYTIAPEADAIIEKYMGYGNLYFVANKIDLKNKHAQALRQAQALRGDLENNLAAQADGLKLKHSQIFSSIMADCRLPEYSGDVYSKKKELSYCALEKVRQHFDAQGHRTEALAPEAHFEDVYRFRMDDDWLISFADFENLPQSYFFIKFRGQAILTDFYPRAEKRNTNALSKAGVPFQATQPGPQTLEGRTQSAGQFADMIRQTLAPLLAGMNELDILRGKIEQAQRLKSEIEQIRPENFVCALDRHRHLYSKDMPEELWDQTLAPYDTGEFAPLCKDLLNLHVGMATPLKFTFQPQTAWYPLNISSLGKGHSVIEVYVLADNAVHDANKIMLNTESQQINSDLRKELEGKVKTNGLNYVTRLSWEGNLEDLTADAVFK